jgi:uncharacterized protein YecT (DUF1311 family)
MVDLTIVQRSSAMRLVLPALAVIMLSTAAAHAQDCANAQDQATLNQCAGAAFEKADKQLNEAYKQIGERLKDNAESHKLLVETQRAWVAWRDAECNFQGGPVDQAGSIYPLVVANCKATLTENRLEDFHAYLNCQEGDVTCPVPASP